jgi:hypothetical protein
LCDGNSMSRSQERVVHFPLIIRYLYGCAGYLVEQEHGLKEDCFDGLDVEVILWMIGDLIRKMIEKFHCRTSCFGMGSITFRMDVHGIRHRAEQDSKEGNVDRLI